MISCAACDGFGNLDINKRCTVCDGFGCAPGCETCQRIPDSELPSDSAHTCQCGVMWGLDTRGTRYWVAPVNLSELNPALKG